MGGEYNTRTYKGALSKDKVRKMAQATTDDMNFEDGHGSYSGHWGVKEGGIDFNSTTFTSEQKADDWLCDNNDKWGNIGACYFEQKLGTESQNERIINQREKVRVAEQNVRIFHSDVLEKIKGVKAKTKKCKSCGTVHQISNIGSIHCSNCRAIMLTDTEVKKETKLKAKVETEKAKVTTMISKRGGKTEKGWLVGGWCSC